MAKPTERALKRKPMAVILLTTLRKDVPNVPDSVGGREFEWFENADKMKAYFDQNVVFHTEDATENDDMAYMAVEVTDTAAMTLGRMDVQPVIDKTTEWMGSIKDDITKAFQPVRATTSKEEDGTKKVVRPRRKSTAAAAVQKDDSKAKAARLKERLAEKQEEIKGSEVGDKPPVTPKVKPKAPARKTPAKKPTETAKAVEDKGFVVRKAATASA